MPAHSGWRTRAPRIVGAMLRATAVVAGYGALSLGCSSQGQTVSVLIPRLDGNREVSFDIASCPHYPQSTEMDRVCVVDSNGKTYPEDGTLWTLPADPPYAVFYQFKPGYTPVIQDLDTTSDDPSIGVFAAPYVFPNGRQSTSSHCCAEDSPANRIRAFMSLTQSGGLLVVVTAAQPAGDQIAVILGYGRLFESRINPCTLPDQAFCQQAKNSGFAVRFYVGAGGSQPPPSDAGPPPTGACLLEYNDALVSAGADPCCYRQGGSNNCHAITQCNDLSGAGCCLVYGTENTAGGGRCCLYESGELGDDPGECQLLLAAP